VSLYQLFAIVSFGHNHAKELKSLHILLFVRTFAAPESLKATV
jgi:hypothetical protein